jgi:CBS domain-containing protein
MRGAFGSIPKEFVSETRLYDFKDPVSEVLPKVERLSAVVVTKNGSYYGLVDDRVVAGKGAVKLGSSFAVGKFAKRVPFLTKESEIKKAIEMFYSSGTKALPFFENGKVKGIVKRSEILKSILSMHLLSTLKVNDIMSTPIIAVDEESSIGRAKNAMYENNVNRIAVLSKGKFYGIVTAKDLMEYGMHDKSRLPEFSGGSTRHEYVRDITQRDPHSAEYGSSVESAIRDFIEKNISSLPVLKNGRPVGIITVRDIFETIVKNAKIEHRNIIISGLDERTKEFEGEITFELESLADRIDRFGNSKVDYIALNIKPVRQRTYELRARLGLVKGGVVHEYVSGYSLEATLKQLSTGIYNTIRDRHEVISSGRKF